MASVETCKPAFANPPATNFAGIPVNNLRLVNPNVSYGLPYSEACAKHISETFRASRVYIVASRSLTKNTDRTDRLVEAIGKDKVVAVRDGITPHTPWSQVLEIAADCRAKNADCLVTLGAGSITDGCKLVVFALANDIKTPSELARYSFESREIPSNVAEPSLPLITIPTSLSGGEYFGLAGGTDDSTGHKQGFLHSGMGAKLIILDPELCLTTPEYHWLSTGVRSFDHCVEGLCSLDGTSKSDETAEEGLRLLAPALLKCKTDPEDVGARRKCQLAVGLAMNSVRAGVSMGGSHAIGHQLGPLGVAHGITSCIMCPAVMKFNMKHAGDNQEIPKKQKKVRDILWSEPDVAQKFHDAGLNEQTADLGDCLDVIIRRLGLPRSLNAVDIDSGVIPQLSQRALSDFWAATNPVPLVRAEQIQEILEMVA